MQLLVGIAIVAVLLVSLLWPRRKMALTTPPKHEAYKLPSEKDFEGIYRRSADPLADNVVRLMKANPHDRGYLEKVKRESLEDTEAGRACRAFLEHVNTVPEWMDFETVSIAGDIMLMNSMAMGVAGISAIIESYTFATGAKVLLHTGRLTTRAALIRLYETAQLLVDGMYHGMRPGERGHETAVSVRLLHAFVRKHVLDSGKWDTATDGAPACQADLVHTLALFVLAYLEPVRQLGGTLTREEVEAWYLFWRYMGHVLGVDPALLPPTYEGMEALKRISWHVDQRASDAGQTLTDATLAGIHMRPMLFMPRRALGTLVRRTMLTPRIADDMGVDKPLPGADLFFSAVCGCNVVFTWLLSTFPLWAYGYRLYNRAVQTFVLRYYLGSGAPYALSIEKR